MSGYGSLHCGLHDLRIACPNYEFLAIPSFAVMLSAMGVQVMCFFIFGFKTGLCHVLTRSYFQLTLLIRA